MPWLPSVARTTHISNIFPRSQRRSSHWGSTVIPSPHLYTHITQFVWLNTLIKSIAGICRIHLPSAVSKDWHFGHTCDGKGGIIRNALLFSCILITCKLQRKTLKPNLMPSGLYSVCEWFAGVYKKTKKKKKKKFILVMKRKTLACNEKKKISLQKHTVWSGSVLFASRVYVHIIRLKPPFLILEWSLTTSNDKEKRGIGICRHGELNKLFNRHFIYFIGIIFFYNLNLHFYLIFILHGSPRN